MIVLPDGTGLEELERIDGAALGTMSAGIGDVSASQTYLDIGQGARTNPSLYDGPTPIFDVKPSVGIPERKWREASARARDVPADLVPGLLASELDDAGIDSRASPGAGIAAIIAADRFGEVEISDCTGCGGLTVRRGTVADARRVARNLGEEDLLVAFEAPPPTDDRALAIAVAGLGPGTLNSESTRLDGYVLATDIAPTILEKVGIEVPDQMAGRALSTSPELEVAAIESLSERLAQVSPRRGEAIGWTLVIWALLAALAGAIGREHALRRALVLLALSVFLLPSALLLTAALEPSEWVERLIAWLGPPAVAALLTRLAGPWRALALTCGLTVGAHAVDVIAGSPLTSRSLLGPNPALGVRFYGIGNELEAVLVVLVVIGAGAALAGWRPDAPAGFRAWAFALWAAIGVIAFAPGRFGADVGAAIAIPAAAAVAIAVVLGARRWWLLAILASPAIALAALAALDLVLGGDAHLSRSVLEAGGLDEVGEVAERRVRLGAGSFERYADSPVLWATAAIIVAAVARRRDVLAWFEGRADMRAAFLGAVAGTVLGTLANDSGALLLMVGTALTSLSAGYAWAVRAERV